MTPADGLPPYAVRESARARRVRLYVSPRDGVVVVVPRGFDARRLPALLAPRGEWLCRTLARVRGACPPGVTDTRLPDSLALPGIAQNWRVDYRPVAVAQFAFLQDGTQRLEVRGPIYRLAECRAALRGWLMEQARPQFAAQLHALSRRTGLAYAGLRVKNQKTRWGSCSSRKNLNLNYKLVFLPPELVRYVLLHELCHTAHLDHSPRFWALLESLEPACRALDGALDDAWRYIPGWAE